MASLAASAASEGAVLGLGGLLPVTSTVNAITITSETSQPKMNAAPFLTPPSEARMRMNAVSGIGWSVIARPMRTRLRTIMCVPICRRHCTAMGHGHDAVRAARGRGSADQEASYWSRYPDPRRYSFSPPQAGPGRCPRHCGLLCRPCRNFSALAPASSIAPRVSWRGILPMR